MKRPGYNFALVDFGGTGITKDELEAWAQALTIQLQRDLAPRPPFGLGFTGTARRAHSAGDLLDDDIIAAFFEHPDIAEALGYHDRAPDGRLLIKIFPLLDKQDNAKPSVTLSHEGIECGADANCADETRDVNGLPWAKEPADAVEQDTYDIEVQGEKVAVSNFILEPWYGAITGKIDFMGLCTRPLEVRPGGYAQYVDAAGWHQVYARHPQTNMEIEPRAYRRMMIERGAGRGGRRRKQQRGMILPPAP